MNWCIPFYHSDFNNEVKFLPFSEKDITELFKTYPQALYRLPYFIQEEFTTQINTLEKYNYVLSQQQLPTNGSLIITHSVKRAKDIVLDPIGIENITCQLEIAGNKLPELPPKHELETLLNQDNTFIIIDGKLYKPQTEILTFQHVYDDTVRFIDQLKKIGISSEYIQITATAEEISLEIHPKAFNITHNNKLPILYNAFIFKLAGIKQTATGWLKTYDKTIDLNTHLPNYKILLPGNVHPTLHRPKVAVGPSHFAYGIAAFADYCGKKRTLDECVKEFKNWLKFITSDFQPISKVTEFINSLEPITSNLSETLYIFQTATTPKTSKEKVSPTLTPFFSEIKDKIIPNFYTRKFIITNSFNEWIKTAGGAITFPSIHLFTGCKEEGKLTFILNLLLSSIHSAQNTNILLCSCEHSSIEIFSRLFCIFNKIQLNEFYNLLNIKLAKSNDQNYNIILNKLSSGIQNIPSEITQSLYFRGVDSLLDIYDINSLTQLLKMLPHDKPTILVIESLYNLNSEYLDKLKTLALNNNLALFLSLHDQNIGNIQKPHIVEGHDLEILYLWQKYFDTITILQSEKVNLKKFIALTQGKVEPTLIEKLEKFFLQQVGNNKSKNDSYTFVRIIHTKYAPRLLILYYYQRDFQLFVEGPSIHLMKN